MNNPIHWNCRLLKPYANDNSFAKAPKSVQEKLKALLRWSIFKAVILILLIPTIAFAADGQGEMGANLIDPLRMELQEAIEWCKENPAAIKCDEVLEKVKEQEYKVLTVTFE